MYSDNLGFAFFVFVLVFVLFLLGWLAEKFLLKTKLGQKIVARFS